MVKFCFKCGNELTLTNLNVYFCANCGKLIENNQDEEESDNKNPSYVG